MLIDAAQRASNEEPYPYHYHYCNDQRHGLTSCDFWVGPTDVFWSCTNDYHLNETSRHAREWAVRSLCDRWGGVSLGFIFQFALIGPIFENLLFSRRILTHS
jgi:hypothetical protein